MKKDWQIVKTTITAVLKGSLGKTEAAKLLSVSQRTIRRYLTKAINEGVESLQETRGGNHRKLTWFQIKQIQQLKRAGPWRSARWIKDKLNLSVDSVTVWRTLGNLNRLNYEQVKPIVRFEAKYSNELWQTDIMGKIFFPKINTYLYLIATLDDHSRFCLSGQWYQKQSKINVFYKRKELPNNAGYEDSGYQREPAKNKVESIKKYIVTETKNPLFPTAITVSSESELKFDEKANGFGELTINPTLHIIDGQHRFKAWVDLMKSGYEEFEDFEMPLVILSGFSELDEVVQFHVINSRQTKVKTDLAHRHYLKLSKDKSTEGLIKERDRWIVRANVIANQLNEEMDGVWNGYMYNANESTDKKRRIPIGVSAFATSLKPLFQKGKLFENPENQSDSAELLALFWKQISEV